MRLFDRDQQHSEFKEFCKPHQALFQFHHSYQEIHQLPCDQQKTTLNNTIEEWRGDLDQVDDILVIGVQV